MFHAYLIEIGAQAVGVVAPASDGYRFFAVEDSFHALEDRIFDSAESARNAALDLYREVDARTFPAARRQAERDSIEARASSH